MRSLFVLRHGKSDWDSPAGGDHDRPLKPRGRRASKRMGRHLTESGFPPHVVYTSTALRAQSTAELAHTAGEWTCSVERRDELYLASSDALLRLLQEVSPSHERVLLVGHEPGLSGCIGLLTDSAPPRFPTAALARVDLEVPDWNDLAAGRGQLAWLITPRALAEP